MVTLKINYDFYDYVGGNASEVNVKSACVRIIIIIVAVCGAAYSS